MRVLYLFTALLCLLCVMAGCTGAGKKKKTNWFTDFARLNKDPYSPYLTYENLPRLFPGARTEKLKGDYRLTNLGYRLRKNSAPSLLMMMGLNTRFAEGEADSLFSFVQEGNHVLLTAQIFDQDFLDRLSLKLQHDGQTDSSRDQRLFLNNAGGSSRVFPYRYRDIDIRGHFESLDTINAPFTTIGTNQALQPDCIVFTLGKGRLILHAAPAVFTNYFLLQQSNHEYLGALFRYIPGEIGHVYFSSYNYREVSNSEFWAIWKNKSTRTALLLALPALLLFVLFEMKRRQKIIPIIPPVENASVAFAETIGRLYFNKKNHTNLAEKMVQHFLEYVRQHYYLNTSQLDNEFVKLLAAKSGRDYGTADTLVYTIKEVQRGTKADEAFLYSLYHQIQHFYHGA